MYWLVEHPISQYNENVKELAKQHNLRVLDARFAGIIDQDKVAKDTPKLTKIGEKPKRTRKTKKAE